MMRTVGELRREYARGGLDETDLDPDPIAQFQRWFAELHAVTTSESNAMVVATASRDGIPSARVVLLKDLDERGFVFYTNYESRKGQDLAENPHAALTFFWPELERQVRIAGAVERVERDQSRRYFDSRPLGSRLGASLSRQSAVIPNRAAMEAEYARLLAGYEADPEGGVPLPDHWGGYRVVPTSIEFWQGRPSRLHDRLRYTRQPNGSWLIERLSP